MKLATAKLHPDAASAALKLMDCLFSAEEMVNSNPSGVSKSKDAARIATICPLGRAARPTTPAQASSLFKLL